MKKCPKCKAEIQEEARFCLYCMTSFEGKQTIETPKENNRRWIYVIAAVFVLVLIALSIVFFAQKDNSTNGENDTSSSSSVSSDLNVAGDNESTTSTEQQNGESESNETSTPVNNSQTQTNSKNENDTAKKPSNSTITNNTTPSSNSQNSTTSNNTTSGSSSGTVTNNSTPSTPTSTNNTTNSSSSDTVTNNSTPSASTSTNNTTNDVTSSTPAETQPKYNYVTATIENAYPSGYSTIHAPENAIVITKVNYKEESGNYVIPDTIDGKKVVAIMPSAFSDSSIRSTVKSVTLPGTVRTIWSNAFKDCYNLTDLYIKSAAIGIYEDAFPALSKRNGKLTIHCKRDCRDFDFYYYRNIADRYDADYEEWNG